LSESLHTLDAAVRAGSAEAVGERIRRCLHRLSCPELPEDAVALVEDLAAAAPQRDRPAVAAVATSLAERVRPDRRAVARARAGLLTGDAPAARRALRDPTLPYEAAGAWLAVLPTDEAAPALAPWLARAGREAQPWGARHALLRRLPRDVAGPLSRGLVCTPSDWFSVPTWALDPEGWRALVQAELDPGCNPFTAWRLGGWALRGPKEDRRAVLDLALDAFARIVDTPMDPGNDGGPFCEVADALDAEQLARAEALVARMAAVPGWELGQTRTALAWRRATLDPAYDPTAAPHLSPHDRAWLRGRCLGDHLARGGAWVDPPPNTPLDLLYGLVDRLPAPPEPVIDPALAWAETTEDPQEARRLLVEAWCDHGPVARWILVSATLPHDLALDVLLRLVVRAPVLATQLPPLPPDRWPDLIPLQDLLPPDLYRTAFLAWLDQHDGRSSPWWQWTTFPFAEGLRGLAGPDAPRAVAEALARWSTEAP
jgi:hypothetical protein